MNSEKGVGEVINLGSAFEISIGDTAKCIAEAMGCEIEFLTDNIRLRPEKSEVERLFASNDKAKQLLNWLPLYGGLNGFKLGLSNTIDWFSDKKNLVQYKSEIFNI